MRLNRQLLGTHTHGAFGVNKLAVIHHFTRINLMMIDLVLICVLETVRGLWLGSIGGADGCHNELLFWAQMHRDDHITTNSTAAKEPS